MIHFWTNDIDTAIGHYTQALGFAVAHVQPDEAPHDFCILRLDDHQVMFGVAPTELIRQDRPDRPLMELMLSRIGQAGPTAIYFSVPDVEAHHTRAVDHGARIVEPLWEAPWGLTQYSLLDPDGHALTFFSSRR